MREPPPGPRLLPDPSPTGRARKSPKGAGQLEVSKWPVPGTEGSLDRPKTLWGLGLDWGTVSPRRMSTDPQVPTGPSPTLRCEGRGEGVGCRGGVNSAEPGTEMNGSEGASLDPLPPFQKRQAGSHPTEPSEPSA